MEPIPTPESARESTPDSAPESAPNLISNTESESGRCEFRAPTTTMDANRGGVSQVSRRGTIVSVLKHL